MSTKSGSKGLLARVNFPLYAIQKVTERHILVAGGGGAAKTGVANCIELYELIKCENTDTCRAVRVTHLDTGKDLKDFVYVFRLGLFLIKSVLT